jgi:hypothetical protein
LKINREDVVQAALIVERWCMKHAKTNGCDCPLKGKTLICTITNGDLPYTWKLAERLRARGLSDAD